MALSIGVRFNQKIKVGDSLLQVVSVDKEQGTIIGLSVNGGPAIYVTEYERVEVLPEVFVSCGQPHSAYPLDDRLAFEAPRRIRIERVK